MKTNLFKVILCVLITTLSISCTKDESTSITDTSITDTSTVLTSNTGVKLTAVTSTGIVKPNYTIMMFSTQPTLTTPLPTILKQVTTDSNGLAYFDLNSFITNTTASTYYFEAFVLNGTDNYTWKSISHYSTSLKKGTMSTSSIIVN